MDTSEQFLKQQRGFSLFKQNQEATVKLQEKQKLGIRVGIFKF
ncbi:hypothetical protein [Arsenophonus sp.]